MKGDREAYARALEMLIEGTCDLLNDVRRFTSALCDIRIDDWLYPNTDDEGAYRPWRITPAADEEARVAERKRVAWRRTHIQEPFGVTAEDVIRAYRQAGGKTREAVALLQPRADRGIIARTDVARLARRLYSEHADLWDRFCPHLVPQGCDPRPTAKVIPIRPEA